MIKKRLKWIFLGSIIAGLIIIFVCLFTFLSRTIDAGEMKPYCIDNTKINAASFDNMRHMEYNEENRIEYSFWVAADGLSDQQELFIFQKVQFGPIERTIIWERFHFACHASSDADEIVSQVMFTPRNTRNKKQSVNWMVFYSSNKHHISHIDITIKEDSKVCILKSGVATEQAFSVVLPDLGTQDGVYREFVKAEFFDKEGNLVETIAGNLQDTQ
jgi:hypothetical protein